jgi:phosphoenolpyruvate---glycerone phosphotransferase subunit DhaK
MKKLINDPFQVTKEELEGFVAAFPREVRLVGSQAVVRTSAPTAGKVGVIFGGGSGHEPLFMGYLGKGLADGSPVGNIFASPSPEIILDATRAVSGGAGVIYLYGNYSGDVMNFDMAAEIAAEENVRVDTVRITDDVASAPVDQKEHRRGIAGDFLVLKAAGACADANGDLEHVCAAAVKANDNARSMGVALSSCTIPASGRPIFELGPDEIEVGLGIHGEPGEQRQRLITADEITNQLVNRLLDEQLFQPGDEVAALVNGLGATHLSELFIVFRQVAKRLVDARIRIHRSYVGNISTSLEMAGCSVTLMRLDGELRRWVDWPVSSPYFTQVG